MHATSRIIYEIKLVSFMIIYCCHLNFEGVSLKIINRQYTYSETIASGMRPLHQVSASLPSHHKQVEKGFKIFKRSKLVGLAD